MVLMATSAFAQEATNTNTPVPPPVRQQRGQNNRMFAMADLSSTEMQQIQTAQQIAQTNPTVVALLNARTELDKQIQAATEQAMLAADPNTGSALEKVRQFREKMDAMTPEERRAYFQQNRPQRPQKDQQAAPTPEPAKPASE